VIRAVIAAQCALAVLCGMIGGAAFAADSSLTTLSEQSGFTRTGRYAEVQRLCSAFASRYSRQVRCFQFGTTPEGRPMMALAVSADGTNTASRARDRKRPVVLFQGGIHAGEIDGKDAGFLALREMLQGSAAPGALAKVTMLFVPVFNIDGHERFGAWNRPNQRGPQEMGWRTTAQNLNLNRDYTKAEAPEMQAMLRLLNEWDPIAYADLHVTDGAEFEHDVSVTVSPEEEGDAGVAALAAAVRDELVRRLDAQGSLALAFYPSFDRDDDPASGFSRLPSTPRYSTGYWGLRNRIGILLETDSWKDYPTRVRITRNFIVDLMQLAAERGGQWQSLVERADAASSHVSGAPVPLAFVNTPATRMIDFRGYVYTREPSPISGALVTTYDRTKPMIWHVPLHDEVRPTLAVEAPGAGYVVPAAVAAWLAERLRGHDIRFDEIPGTRNALRVQAFRATRVTLAKESYEGRVATTLEGTWQWEQHDIPPYSIFVPIAQPKARLIMALLEPKAPDSYASWGYFATAFEQKEYVEAYVAEQYGREILEKDPASKAEFLRKLETDKDFARDPKARLDFFYQRQPSWDTAFDLYPVYRVDMRP
jgi:murein tripeptide amidase MpaA